MDFNNLLHNLDFPTAPDGLYEPIVYTLASGGKRLRPQLVLLGSQLFDGQEQDVQPAALAIEVFHNFTLLHDDVMDKADVRRGRPTVHVKWNENTAILSGDQMLIEAYKLLSQVSEDKLPRVLQLFNQMATAICEGQQYDMDFESREDVAIDEYIQMIRLKTAVLLGYALRIGAYIAGADDQQQQSLFDYGINIGLAFQIQDDLLDVYGDPATFGKAIGGDILCGKKTFMLLTAFKKASSEIRQELQQTLLRTDMTNNEKISAVTAVYDMLNVRQDAEKFIQHYTDNALLCLQQLPLNEANNRLRELAEKLSERKR